MTAADPEADRHLVVLASSRGARRSLGPLPWSVLEALALRARPGGDAWVAESNVRALAAELGVGKDTAAGALRRLAGAGLVSHASRRAGGRYTGSVYVLDVGACQRAGLLLPTNPSIEAPRLHAPCPGGPVAAEADPPRSDAAMAGPGDAASSNEAGRSPEPLSQASLFSLLDEPSPLPPVEPTTPNDPHPTSSDDPSPSNHPVLPPTDPLLLPTPNRPDALAPGVQGGVVNILGNMNGNLNEGVDRC